jgi:hypothetical protein
MSLSWYNLTATIPNGSENIIVNYYFSVINDTKIINSFYNYNDICVDILIQISEDNLFDFTTFIPFVIIIIIRHSGVYYYYY